jgi:dephospho-CoA kinase
MCLKIGLTGGIACGKSLVSKLFAGYGVPIIDADQIAHELVQTKKPALATIAQVFGHDILNTDGSLNRAKLRELIFADAKQRQRLEAILHPLVYANINAQLEQLIKCNCHTYCIISIPLLVENQRQFDFDRVLVVDCSTEQQRQRLQQRNQFDAKMIAQMLAAQAEREQRLAVADDVIINDQDLEYLRIQVHKLHLYYCKMLEKTKP